MALRPSPSRWSTALPPWPTSASGRFHCGSMRVVASATALSNKRQLGNAMAATTTRGLQHRGVSRDRRECVEVSARRSALDFFVRRRRQPSYSNVRRFLTGGSLPPRTRCGVEEMINYFPLRLSRSRGAPIRCPITTEGHPQPWNGSHKLMLIGLPDPPHRDEETCRPTTLVFLLDVLRVDDRTEQAAAREAGLPAPGRSASAPQTGSRSRSTPAPRVWFCPPRPGNQRETILAAIERLERRFYRGRGRIRLA
jgi:Ca-activated chloride channel family protein